MEDETGRTGGSGDARGVLLAEALRSEDIVTELPSTGGGPPKRGTPERSLIVVLDGIVGLRTSRMGVGVEDIALPFMAEDFEGDEARGARTSSQD